jgi:hypothetical protein
MGLSSSVTPRGAAGVSSSVTPLGAVSSLLKLPVESRLPLVKLPACFRGKGTRVLDGAGCSTGAVAGAGAASVVPFVVTGVVSWVGLSSLPGTSSEPRFVPLLLRVSVGEDVFTGNRV